MMMTVTVSVTVDAWVSGSFEDQQIIYTQTPSYLSLSRRVHANCPCMSSQPRFHAERIMTTVMETSALPRQLLVLALEKCVMYSDNAHATQQQCQQQHHNAEDKQLIRQYYVPGLSCKVHRSLQP